MGLDIDDGRLDSAQQQAAAFAALDDDDPEAHLMMAMGFARFLRFAESDEQLALAAELGYDPELGSEPSAKDLYLRALWLVAQRDSKEHAEAAELLGRAAASEELRDHVWFPLYQMRKATGDRAGARAALVEFIGSLKGRDDFTGVAQALLAELDGEHLGAVGILEKLRGRITEQRASELRLHRHLGRNYLLEYLAHPGEQPELLDSADAALQVAVSQLDDDGNAWAALAMIQKLRADLEIDIGERERSWKEAEALAARATERGLGQEMGAEVMVMVAFERFAATFESVERSDERELDEIERRRKAFSELEPGSPMLPILDSGVAYYRGAYAFARGDKAAARRHWTESVDTYERQLYARVRLAQRLYMEDEDYRNALDLLKQALALWDSRTFGVPGWDPSRERKWLLATAIWMFGAADHAGDVALARQAAERAMSELELDDRAAEAAEMESLAEFFALPLHDELKDCETALSLLETYGVDEHYEGDAAVEDLLAKIRAACE
jgi:tetratricopeptide (TPR) repeat protein